MASLVTVGLIEKLRDDMAQAIAVDGVIEFKHDLVLRQICDLAIEALLAPEDSAAFADVRRERARQIEDKHWTPQQDDCYARSQLAEAAASYAMVNAVGLADALEQWPWAADSFKPGDARRNLVKAGALIIAEIERLDRAEARNPDPQEIDALLEETAPLMKALADK